MRISVRRFTPGIYYTMQMAAKCGRVLGLKKLGCFPGSLMQRRFMWATTFYRARATARYSSRNLSPRPRLDKGGIAV